ncbi:MAG: hypothetical protein ABIF77_15190 [bacterium]
MIRVFIWTAIGIGIIIYNHSGTDTQLIIRGTGIDFGYLAIGVGVFHLIRVALTRSSGKSGKAKKSDVAAQQETVLTETGADDSVTESTTQKPE